ncbi:MAG: hypothetical protein K2Q12_04465 [Rickettsiales bacterium]|nr:hypothetical protein [Rickettsiales bacterium]
MRLIHVTLFTLALLLSITSGMPEALAQTQNAVVASPKPQFWISTPPQGSNAPTVYGYGVPPRHYGAAYSYATSPMDQALSDTVQNLAQPLLPSVKSDSSTRPAPTEMPDTPKPPRIARDPRPTTPFHD